MITKEQRDAIHIAARRAAMPMRVVTLRAGGGKELATESDRAELLRRAVAREDVRLEIDLLAYEQKAGEPNRNYVRFRDSAMSKLASSGKDTPFLRDHRQYDSTAVGGRVIASRLVKVEKGHYQILQTVELSEPSAVERALRNLMSACSIGWMETGPIICTACGSEVFDECWHYPGASVSREDGSVETVEWEFTSAELVETSEVPVGGVPTAGLEGIRAALSALGIGNRGPEPHEEHMNLLKVLAPILGLGATATEDEATAAVKKLASDLATAKAELGISEKDRQRLQAIADKHEKTEAQDAEDKFIAAALSNRQIGDDDVDVWRTMHQTNPTVAVEKMAKLAHNRVPPKAGLKIVKEPAQRDKEEPKELAAAEADAAIDTALAENGVNPKAVAHFAGKFGAKNHRKTLAGTYAAGEEG